ncbi:S8 family peptidase [Paenibacillus sp. FSL W7-1287]|uniref:S8 family peptidase n=1 Tax=Paenibacillus sp. FSL W7-1287 TaxID=2954538 RepID=UPI0030F5BECA
MIKRVPIKSFNHRLKILTCVLVLVIFSSCGNSQGLSDKVVSQERLSELSLESNQIIPWGVAYQNFSEVHNSEKKVKIAIMDSGIDFSHIELEGKIVKEYDALLDQENQTPTDSLGHGTAIAGIISANDNDIGIVGVSSNENVELYSVKVLNDTGKGETSHLISGIEWCIENNIDIINMSFGILRDREELREVIDNAVNNGIIIVAAVGNKYRTSVDFPAGYPNVISVTAIDVNENKLFSASEGKVDFSAPGVDILTISPNNEYQVVTGTSFASAHITGVISNLLLNRNYEKNYDLLEQIKSDLISLSHNLGPDSDHSIYGYGSISIKN